MSQILMQSARRWLTAAVTLGTLPFAAQAQVIFTDNFDSGASPLWGNQRGNWVASGGVYDAQSPTNNPLTYSGLPFVLTDFSVDVDINQVGDGGIWLRSDASGQNGVLLVTGGYSWGYPDHGPDPTTGRNLYWHVVVNGNAGHLLNVVSNVFSNPGVQDVHIHVTAIGNTFSAYVDGSLTPTATFTESTFSSGRAGLYDF